jgi:alanine racemase
MPVNSVPDDVRTWAEIDATALRHNLAFVRQQIGPRPEILAVVKADAYGHGVREVVRALAAGTDLFGVSNLAEAREVGEAATGREIMILSPCLPAEREGAVRGGFIVTVSSAKEAVAFAQHGPVRVNLKIDTGMGRIGCGAASAPEEVQRIQESPGLLLHSISTHLPTADEETPFTAAQLNCFAALAAELRFLAPEAKFHVLNSAGVLTRPELAFEIVRPGLMLYGISPVPGFQSDLMPALAWRARVGIVRDLPAGAGVSYGRSFITPRPMKTAVIAAGYADGFPRQASGNGAGVLLHGERCPLLGRITMDQIVVDISRIPETRPGDVATILGRDGNESISANELAKQAGTIPWHILTGIGRRVVRFPI